MTEPNRLPTMSPEQAKQRLEEIRARYKRVREDTTFSALIMGEYSSGKTTLLSTAPGPILIDSFDPIGTLTLEDLMEKRDDILVRPYWNEDSQRPTELAAWQKEWQADLKSGFLATLGTYCIDSLTTFTEAITNHVAKKAGRTNSLPAIQDYQIIYNMLKDYVKLSSSQGCNFICTGHLVVDKDEVTGQLVAELDTYKRLKSRIPLLFTEKYVMITKDSPRGPEYKILTGPKGRYRAGTQLGSGGKFDLEEVADLKVLLKKAGKLDKVKGSY